MMTSEVRYSTCGRKIFDAEAHLYQFRVEYFYTRLCGAGM